MSSPVFGAMGSQNGGNMMQQFQQFMQQMKGKNPQEEINKLLQSGAAIRPSSIMPGSPGISR